MPMGWMGTDGVDGVPMGWRWGGWDGDGVDGVAMGWVGADEVEGWRWGGWGADGVDEVDGVPMGWMAWRCRFGREMT